MVAPQVKRIVKMLELFSLGRKLTSGELCAIFENEVTLRTIQRDLQTIQQAGIPLSSENTGKRESAWYLSRSFNRMVLPMVEKSEMTALYQLKLCLSHFSGTKISKSVQILADALDKIAPGELFLEFEPPGDLLWQQDHGFAPDRAHDLILARVVDIILVGKWVSVTYQARGDKQAKTLDVYPQRLFTWRGLYYMVAGLADQAEPFSIALNCIRELIPAEKQDYQVPLFDPDKFRKQRFGVFEGRVGKVKLNILPAYADYFSGRNWHPSQRTERQSDNSLRIDMRVPISPELISWIMSWAGAVVVVQPHSLIRELVQRSEAILQQYKTESTFPPEERYALYKPGLNFP